MGGTVYPASGQYLVMCQTHCDEIPPVEIKLMTSLLTPADYVNAPTVTGDHRYAYGELPDQYGELFMPDAAPPDGGYPTMVLLHGGCWRERFGAAPMGQLARAISGLGYAVWNVEYRRIDGAGGWPTTFEDVGGAIDFLRTIALERNLNLTRIVAAGHSAGGHLALWLGGRAHIPQGMSLSNANPLVPSAVVSFAGIGDLADALEHDICGTAVAELMGGTPAQYPERYEQGSPHALLPLGVPHWHIFGTRDALVSPDHIRRFVSASTLAGDNAQAVEVEGVGHFEIVLASSSVWSQVEDVLRGVAV
jgi:acetyl esterase/lipase